MIIPDKKKMATMIVADMHAPEAPEDADSGDAFEAIATDILSAVKSGSASDLAAALKAFSAECEARDYSEE